MSGAPSIKAEGTVPVLCFCRVCASIREIYAVMAMRDGMAARIEERKRASIAVPATHCLSMGLAKFMPTHSNSVQRLSAMRHVASTTENWRTRAIVQKEVDRLSSLPTNQLNDISWIAEDVTGGK